MGQVGDETLPNFESLLATGNTDCSGDGQPRAWRFDVQLPLRYRAKGETEWREGRTVNISHTGALFLTDWSMEVHTEIEMSLEMPTVTRAEIVCRGEIVRTVLPASREAQPSLAARIIDYHFVRRQRTGSTCRTGRGGESC